MDGIVSGLASIIPIIPDQSIITDKNGANKPPVEIMPLPENSFLSDNATAEMLNNPFTLSLDIKGHNSADAYGGRVGTNGTQAARPVITDDPATDVLLSQAYTLSLGNEEDTPIAVDIAREMSRMRNYEMIGKNGAHQAYRINPETGAAEHIAARFQGNTSAELISEKVRSLLSQTGGMQQDETIVQAAAQNGEINTVLPEGTFNSLPVPDGEALAGTGLLPAAASNRQGEPILAELASVPLSASDIEAILTLEPDLQEALLNMLSKADISISGKPADTISPAAETARVINPQSTPDTAAAIKSILPNTDILISSQPGIIQQSENDITGLLKAPELKQITVPVDVSAGTISPAAISPKAIPPETVFAETIYAEAAIANRTIEALIGERVQGPLTRGNMLPDSILSGNMANLQKVNELPYAFYIFGNVSAEDKHQADDDADITITEESNEEKKQSAALIRISEAVKMASVLHNIYYGGSGRFPQETPWYAPYIRYAVKNGIIEDDEFTGCNAFASRAEVAYIFSHCVPLAEFPSINYVPDIADISEAAGYGESIYLLYRAGVLTGDFNPESTITRSEAAAIIGRIATPGDRKRI
jgi:hypothetical protein